MLDHDLPTRGLDPGESSAAEFPYVLGSLRRYVVQGPLGRGGMGVVVEAIDTTLNRRVAIKVLHGGLGVEHTRRMLREAQALATLAHPNVVEIYETGLVDGQAYIVMELVQGSTLRAWVNQDPRPSWRQCVDVYVSAGQGLVAVHARGLVHRDFKPSNAVVDESGRVRVLDFGLARHVGTQEEAPSEPIDVSAGGDPGILGASLTETGMVQGTPAYMPPEQMQGIEVDARSDQFSFCVSLYEALCGARPFEGNTMAELMGSMLARNIRPLPADCPVPKELRAALWRGMEVDPRRRWPSMEALLTELGTLSSRRRRTWPGALVVGAGVLALGAVLVWPTEHEVNCDSEHKLAGIWDDERREVVEASIAGTELRYAPQTWSRVQQRLDDYARQWIAKHQEVCEATLVTDRPSARATDLRMACLQDRRGALRAAVDVLAEANATRVSKAVGLVTTLPGLARCDDLDALEAELPPPDNPGDAERVEQLRARLQHARMLEEAGAFDDGLEVAQRIQAEAETVDYAPVQLEADLRTASLFNDRGDYDEAERRLEGAYARAVEHGHDEVQRAAALGLAHVVGYRRGDAEAGLKWGKTALARSTTPRDRGDALNVLGTLQLSQGRLAAAFDEFERSLALRQEALGPEHPLVGASLNNLGIVTLRQGRPTESLEHLHRALEVSRAALGAGHPAVASTLNNMGLVFSSQGDDMRALEVHRQALAIREHALGPHHSDVATSLNNIAVALRALGEFDEAATHLERTLAIAEKTQGRDHPRVASVLNNIGAVLQEQQRLPEALAHHQRALIIRQENLGPDHPQLGETLVNICMVLRAQEREAEALDHCQRGLAQWERVLGQEHPNLAQPLLGIADISMTEGRLEAARAHAERAVSLRESAQGPPADLATARFILAQTLRPDPTQCERARRLAEQARDAYAALGPTNEKARQEVEAWLAEHSC
ncbi:MAG: serine/threonine-protein kinase [Myxococcota bacterium]